MRIPLNKSIWFDKSNMPVLICGVAMRDLEQDEILYYYGEVLME